jgi:hypothetical protein
MDRMLVIASSVTPVRLRRPDILAFETGRHLTVRDVPIHVIAQRPAESGQGDVPDDVRLMGVDDNGGTIEL